MSDPSPVLVSPHRGNERTGTRSRERGGVTLLVLVLLIVFVVLMTASIQFIARQSKQTSRHQQEQLSFGLADSGVQYALWLLSAGGDGGTPLTPTQLNDSLPDGVVDHAVTDDAANEVGTFSVQFLEVGPEDDYLKIKSTGRDVMSGELCQVVEAELHQSAEGVFEVTAWNQLPGYQCAATAPAASPPRPSVRPSPRR